jgi:hypothetical protein
MATRIRSDSWAFPGLRVPRFDAVFAAARFVGLVVFSIALFCASLVAVGFLLHGIVRAIF